MSVSDAEFRVSNSRVGGHQRTRGSLCASGTRCCSYRGSGRDPVWAKAKTCENNLPWTLMTFWWCFE